MDINKTISIISKLNIKIDFINKINLLENKKINLNIHKNIQIILSLTKTHQINRRTQHLPTDDKHECTQRDVVSTLSTVGFYEWIYIGLLC